MSIVQPFPPGVQFQDTELSDQATINQNQRNHSRQRSPPAYTPTAKTHLRMGAFVAFPALFITLVAFVCLLLVTLSVPIIKGIYLFKIFVDVDGLAGLVETGEVKAGTFGFCSSGIASLSADALGNLGIGSKVIGPSGCTNARLGYDIPQSIFNALDEVPGVDISGIDRAVIKKLTYVLVLFPIATGFAGLVLFFTFLAWILRSRISEIIAFLLSWLSALVAWIAFIVGIAAFSIAKRRIDDITGGALKGSLGNALWLGLAAAILLTFTICLTCCGMFGPYRKRGGDEGHNGHHRAREMSDQPANSTEPTTRRRFWNMAEKRENKINQQRSQAAAPAAVGPEQNGTLAQGSS